MFVVKLNPVVVFLRVEVGCVVSAIVCYHSPQNVFCVLVLTLTYLQKVLNVDDGRDDLKYFLYFFSADFILTVVIL